MLRTVNAQPSLWETILPAAVLGMPAELEAVDRLLDDPRFFEPYRLFFHASLGRPSVPIETYLRLMGTVALAEDGVASATARRGMGDLSGAV